MLPGAVGLMQATEVIKLVLGEGLPMIGRLLLYDAMKMSFREVKVRRNPDCELCGEHPSLNELIDYQAFCNVPLGVEEAGEFDGSAYEMTPEALKQLLDSDEQPVLLDVRGDHRANLRHACMHARMHEGHVTSRSCLMYAEIIERICGMHACMHMHACMKVT